MTGRNSAPRGYAKPIVVPDRLDLLCGPETGVVHLPRHLKWSGSAHYDLTQPGRIVDLYRTVLNEAASQDDLHTYVNKRILTGLWASIWLPPAVRHAWEDRFPELRRRRQTAA